MVGLYSHGMGTNFRVGPKTKIHFCGLKYNLEIKSNVNMFCSVCLSCSAAGDEVRSRRSPFFRVQRSVNPGGALGVSEKKQGNPVFFHSSSAFTVNRDINNASIKFIEAFSPGNLSFQRDKFYASESRQ